MNTLRLLPLALCGLLALSPGTAAAQSSAGTSLGAVVDTRFPHADGPAVLAITPGGTAQTLGLQAGDRLLSVNGAPLRSQDNIATRLERALETGGGSVRLEVLRAGERLELSGPMQAAVPASSGCGYVSDDDPTPVVSDGIHAVEITSIDGDSTPLDPQNRYRLSAGEHVLVVSEQIAGHHFSGRQNQLREQMKQRTLARAYKALVVTVEPGVRYSVGAKLLRDSMDNDAMRANAYWEPVVFKQRAQECR